MARRVSKLIQFLIRFPERPLNSLAVSNIFDEPDGIQGTALQIAYQRDCEVSGNGLAAPCPVLRLV
jgi:hypothetical protein